MSEGLRDRESWPYLVDALEDAINRNDGTGLAWFAMISVGREEDGTYPGATYGKNHLPVRCADWPATTWEQMRPDAAVIREHPLWGRIEPARPPECVGWKGSTRVTLLVGAEPATPVLVVGNDGDPVTPIENTEHLSTMLVRSRLVTVDADAHGAYSSGSSCLDDIVEAYLVKAMPPPSRTKC